eukprot:CAMPEP_0167794100 /NCGR_PEP_ID=MMETSP0111_2-20121227/13612_1 /TAXON_ID=91324 /ORGANISM="Lotharella globosa, Strain CCCM811" /LENGTH=341 /DNA_ID=CAMNT_0007687459 /DNA_START=16 /DNA_END=1041 /DNA_ORIENTATION=+
MKLLIPLAMILASVLADPSLQDYYEPTKRPTKKPTKKPTKRPTKRPTKYPTKRPTKRPTKYPYPTKYPTHYTPEPTPYTPEPTPYTPEPTPYTPEPTPYTPEPTPYTPEPTPYTPEPTPYTPEPTPYTPEPTPYIPPPTTHGSYVVEKWTVCMNESSYGGTEKWDVNRNGPVIGYNKLFYSGGLRSPRLVKDGAQCEVGPGECCDFVLQNQYGKYESPKQCIPVRSHSPSDIFSEGPSLLIALEIGLAGFGTHDIIESGNVKFCYDYQYEIANYAKEEGAKTELIFYGESPDKQRKASIVMNAVWKPQECADLGYTYIEKTMNYDRRTTAQCEYEDFNSNY